MSEFWIGLADSNGGHVKHRIQAKDFDDAYDQVRAKVGDVSGWNIKFDPPKPAGNYVRVTAVEEILP